MNNNDCPWCGSLNTKLYKKKNYSISNGILAQMIIGSFGFLAGFHNNRDEYVCCDCKQRFKQ